MADDAGIAAAALPLLPVGLPPQATSCPSCGISLLGPAAHELWEVLLALGVRFEQRAPEPGESGQLGSLPS